MPQNSHNAFRGCLGDNFDFTLRYTKKKKRKKRAVKSLITLDKYAVLVVGANVQSCQVSGGQTKRRGQQQLDRSSSRVLRWQVHRSATVSTYVSAYVACTYRYIHMYVCGAGRPGGNCDLIPFHCFSCHTHSFCN